MRFYVQTFAQSTYSKESIYQECIHWISKYLFWGRTCWDSGNLFLNRNVNFVYKIVLNSNVNLSLKPRYLFYELNILCVAGTKGENLCVLKISTLKSMNCLVFIDLIQHYRSQFPFIRKSKAGWIYKIGEPQQTFFEKIMYDLY